MAPTPPPSHSPLPWKPLHMPGHACNCGQIWSAEIDSPIAEVWNSNGHDETGCTVPADVARANLDFICQAVNGYGVLREALEQIATIGDTEYARTLRAVARKALAATEKK